MKSEPPAHQHSSDSALRLVNGTREEVSMTTISVMRDTLASVLVELERLDPNSLLAAHGRGVLLGSGWVADHRSKPGPKVNHEQDAAMAADYVSGMSLIQVGSKYGTCPSTVIHSLHRTGTATRPRGRAKVNRADPRLADFMARRDRGETLTEIAAAYKVSRERVRQIFAKAGLETSLESKPLTADQTAAVARYLAGDSLELAAATAGVNPMTLRGWIVKSGSEPRAPTSRRKPETLAKAERAAQLYQRGVTMAGIAKELGLSKPEMAYRFLSLAGVKPNRQRRPPSDSTPARRAAA